MNHLLRRSALGSSFACLCLLGNSLAAQQPLVVDGPEVAGMSGFRAYWDTPVVLKEDAPTKIVDTVIKDRGGQAIWANGMAPIAFDALNRSLLVRFPDAAAKIAAALAKGQTISKVELELPFRDEELWPVGHGDFPGPDGYTYRMNWGVDALYRAIRPQWHAVAWALRRPWKADDKIGPTFNAAVNGTVYWSKYGATDTEHDRFPTRFGPGEVSYKNTDGRIDLTPLLNDPAYGATLAARLRAFSDCGVVVQKEETYDTRFFTGFYEFGTATGGRAILVNTPKLCITFAPGAASLGGSLPPPADIAASAKVGAPTAVMPDAAALQALAQKYDAKPEWMPDWQWQRVQELQSLANPKGADAPFWYQYVPDYLINNFTQNHHGDDPAGIYGIWVDQIIGRQSRGWSGFESALSMSEWYLYHDALPPVAQDCIKRYWTAWLMPDRETPPTETGRRDRSDFSGRLLHPMVDHPALAGPNGFVPDPLHGKYDPYYAKTGDWRGDKSFFRSGFCYTMSTQNFNTTASSGALLGGALIGSDRAMADGRNGVENWLLRTWCWGSGMGQEHLDHYYFAITLAGNKAIADFSSTPYDRLIGQSLITKDVEELVSAYHPGLRSFIAGSSRSSLEYIQGMQDGLQHVMHTLSKSGAERDLGIDTFPEGYKRIGHDVAPDLVARLTLTQPWAPEWVTTMVDDKPLPYEVVGTGWNGLRRAYLGENYGLASSETAAQRFQAMAQWRREAKQAVNTSDLGTMDMRYTVNVPRWTNNGGGYLGPLGDMLCLQNKNRMIVITKPHADIQTDSWKNPVTSLQSSIGLFTIQDKGPTWEIFVDGQRVDKLPFTCKQGQKITIHDGVTYLGIIPLPATDLGRDAEVVLEDGVPQKMDLNFYNSTMKASLVINSYNYKSDHPLIDPTQKAAVAKAYGGFTVELGDVKEWGDFATFQKHIADAKANVNFAADTGTVDVTYTTGKDVLHASSTDGKLVQHTINDVDTNPPAGLELDTPYAQQALGQVSKNGATLTGNPDRRLFLLTEPKAGVYCAWNPLPDLTSWTFKVPGGLTVTAKGSVGLARMVARPKENTLVIDHEFTEEQAKNDTVDTELLLSGVDAPPAVTLNGKTLGNLESRAVDGHKAWVVPLH